MPNIIIHNAKIYLERGRFAEAVRVCGGKIACVGKNKEILAQAQPGIEIIDAGGNLLLPGFNDSHLHLYHYGRDFSRIQANGAASIEELVERGREMISRTKPPAGSVVTGTGWNQELFAEKRFPNCRDIDRISTSHAVIISRICGHSACCNSLAMRMAGISGGGEHLGLFGEGAELSRLRAIVPPFSQQQIEEQLLRAIRHAAANGLTSVGTMDIINGNYQNIIDAYIKIFSEHNLHLRISHQCSIEKESVFDEFTGRGWITGAPMGHPYLTMGASKLFADGSLGARTAYMREPYRDDPGTRGCQIHSQEAMDALVEKNHAGGMQVIVHAIGDAAIDQALNSFEKVLAKDSIKDSKAGHKNRLRHGVVHCQTTDIPILRRMADNGILAFMQPIFLTHDLYMLESRLGKNLASTAFALATMNKMGIRTPYGTDAPVESMNPLDCIACAATRRDVSNGYPEGGFYPGECVDVSAAVDAYTMESAYAEFAEDRKGRIKPHYLADMVLLDRDIFAIPPQEINTARALWTMVGGTIALPLESPA